MKPVFLIASLIVSSLIQAQDTITPAEALKFFDEVKTVCGHVVSTFYARETKTQLTFLNLNKPYPENIFTIVIDSSHREHFTPAPEIKFKDKDVCVSGWIKLHKDKPLMKLNDPIRIEIR